MGLCTTIWLLYLTKMYCSAQFTVMPVSVVQAEGLEAVFECLYPGASATQYGWALNGTVPSEFPNGFNATSVSEDSPARLIIPAIPQYNNTVVQCEAVVREAENPFVLSENVTLQIQGPLHSVSDISYLPENTTTTTITISWTPSFSLNVTTAEPDIQYCVDVYNVTGGGADLLESVCDITDTSYTFSASDPDQLFHFTVTPRSNVEGSLNGTTSQPVQGYIVGVPFLIPAYKLNFWTNVDLDPMGLTFPIEVLGTSPGRMPISFTITVNHSLSWCTCPTTHTIVNSNVELTLICAHNCTLSRHQVYSLTVIATNRAGSSQSFPGLHISTHDVQNVKAVHYLQQQLLTVQCSYLSGSTVRGVFIIAHSPTNISYNVAYCNDTESVTEFSIASHGLQEHHIAVFDLVGNGLPESVPAATVRASDTNDTMSNNSLFLPLPPSLLEVNVTGPGREVCLSCSFSSSAPTGCVGVIHSAQLDNLTLTILTVDSSGGIDCTVLTEGDYHVAVFGLSVNGLGEFPANQSVVEVLPLTTQEPSVTTAINVTTIIEVTTTKPSTRTPKSQNNVALIAGVSSVAVALLLTVCVAAVIIVLIKKRQTKHESTLLENDYIVGPTGTNGHLPSHPVSGRDPQYENIGLIRRPHTTPNEEPPSCTDVVPQNTPLPDTPPPLPVRNITEEGSLVTSQESVAKASLSTLSPLHTQSTPQGAGLEQQLMETGYEFSNEASAAAEPAYDVAKVLLRKPANSNLPADETKTEHQYADIQGTVTEEGVHYAHVNPKPKTRSSPPSVDPTRVVYSKIDKKKLVPTESSATPQPEPPPLPPPPPPPPTAETVLSEIHPIAKSWYDLGEALGVPESTLDKIETEGSDQVRLHDMIQTYFSSEYYTHTWERIAEALHETGEIEAADRIVRTRNLKVLLPELPDDNPPPPLPPRKDDQLTAESEDGASTMLKQVAGSNSDTVPAVTMEEVNDVN